MDAASSIPPPSTTTGSGGVGSTTNNNTNNPPAASTPPLLIARTPLNAYLKIAIIRNPTDEVICNDPEFPGTKKRVVVSELLDGSLTKVGTAKQDDDNERKNNEDDCNKEEAKTKAAVTATTTSNTNNETSAPKNNDNKKETKKEEDEGPKKEIPVPTITTVPTYDLDIPPTYQIPPSYVRYIRPTYHETQHETVEYNIDAEDETWWRNNKDFGPDATCTILIDGKEQVPIKKEDRKSVV